MNQAFTLKIFAAGLVSSWILLLGGIANTAHASVTVDSVVAEIRVGETPARIAVNPLTNTVYVTNSRPDIGTLSIIDGAIDRLATPGSVTLQSAPIGLAIDPQKKRIYAANFKSNTLMILDSDTRAQIAGSPLSVGATPFALAVDTQTDMIYLASNGADIVSVFDGKTNKPAGSPISVGDNPRGLAVNEKTKKIYVANSDANTLTVIDGTNNTKIGSPLAMETNPFGVAVNSRTDTVYVTNVDSNSVTVIDGKTNAQIGTPITVGSSPSGVAVNESLNRIYVTNVDDGTVTVIDGSSNTVIGSPIKVGDYPTGIAVNPVTNKVYVVNTGSNTVSVIQTKLSPTVISGPPPSATVNKAYNFTVTATGFPAIFTFSASGLPQGLVINATTGIISGTATRSGSYPVTVTVSNGVAPDATANYLLAVTGSAADPPAPPQTETTDPRKSGSPAVTATEKSNFPASARLPQTGGDKGINISGACALLVALGFCFLALGRRLFSKA